jgi:thiosulfate dehydrogenase [quinone] large subunit
MKLNTAPAPLQADRSFRRRIRRTWPTWRTKGIAALRILFGLIWAIDAWFKWHPVFQRNIVETVTGAKEGQTGLVQAWITFWAHIVASNPMLFARTLATTETAIAVFLILGLLGNLTDVVGILLALGIWSTAEGFGGPYRPGDSTDIGTAIIYAVVIAILLVVSASRYYGLDQWLTPRLGRFGFLASGTFWRRRREG